MKQGMIKIKLRLSSWIADKLGEEHTGWLTLKKEVGEGSSISDLLAGLVIAYPGLREAVYNPDEGIVDERVNIAVNDNFLNSNEISQTILRDGDTVLLLPHIWGG